MINVSNEFRKLMNTRTDFKENAEITFANGTVLELTEKDFTISNNSVTDAYETNGIPLGVALCRSIQIELMNDDDRFSEYDFFGARIRLYLTFQLSETVERIEYGTFTVITPETYGTTVIITALDDMYKSDRNYESTLVFPATIGSMFLDACNVLGISQGTTTFLNDDFVVNEKPTDITFRQLFGYIAMLAAGNARIDVTGRLRIISYDFNKIDELRNSILDGGSFNPWNNPIKLDGGTFNPWNDGDSADGGTFGDRKDFHVLSAWNTLKVDTDDVVITGISTEYTDSSNEQQRIIYGTEGYVLKINNPLIEGQEQNAVELIGNVMIGGRFRQFSGDLVANPTCEFMDIAIVFDRKANYYFTFLTDINFQFFGFTNLKNSAEPTLRNSAKTYSDATQTLVAARKLIKNERTAREQAVAQLAKDLQNSSGLFMTQEEQADGSIIYYMHDKPTLAESMVVWKLTALAFGISTDGGKTYPYGFTVDGTTITRLLYAEGIDADYIDTGAIRITDTNGNTMFLADYDTKQVYVNADNVFIGSKSVTTANTELSSSITTNANAIKSEVTRAKDAEDALSSKITQTAESITAEVTRAKGAEDSLSSSITVTANAITAEVTRATNAENSLSSRITQTASSIELKVSKGDVSSQLSVESGAIAIKSNRFSWESTYSSLTAQGKLKATDVDLTGKITANSGKIGGMEITSSSIRYGKTSINDGSSGIYIGTDGIAIGYGGRTSSAFKVTSSGDVTVGIQGDFTLERGLLKLNYSTSYIRHLTTDAIQFTGSTTNIISTYSILGKYNGQIGFFGNNGAAKKTVSTITSTSSASTSTCATKINELINALKAYNLIG